MRRFVHILTIAALAACGSTSDEPQKDNDPMGQGGGHDGCPAAGASQCDGLLVQLCTEGDDGLAWSEAEACPGDQRCREGACADATADQLAQIASAQDYVQALVEQSAWYEALDGDALLSPAKSLILDGGGATDAYFTAMRGIHLDVRQGHQSLYDGVCAAPLMPPQASSRFGVCGRPHGDAIVVTVAAPGNLLGLSPGDRIVSAGGVSGPDMLDEAARRPMCAASSPSDSHRRTAAAATFFASVPAGMELLVAPAGGGAERTLLVPDQHDAALTSCQDPLGRDIAFNAQSYLRPDGVAVVRLPRFFPIDKSFPSNPTQEDIDELIQHMQQAVLDAFEPVKNAPALVWDARSNYGGMTHVGLAIASGMPTAVATDLSSCQQRIPGSSPPEFYPQSYAHYQVTPGGPFAYSGKVAVLIDGLDYSAADYFPLAVSLATDTLLVGSETAGAYGASSLEIALAGPPALGASIDVNKCSDAGGVPLEGRGVAPDLVVEYDPADLAAGEDSVLETAVAALLAR
jgi:hypothetical protein